MAGEQDKLIPAEQSRAIAAAIPGAKLAIYPDGGHLPMEQLPDATAKTCAPSCGALVHAAIGRALMLFASPALSDMPK